MSSVTSTTVTSATRTLEELNKTRDTSSNSLDQDDFLKILVAQMSNQDPMEPTDNGEFLAQMAQFTMLEQIKEMSASFSSSQAYSMVGKYVYVQDGDDLIFGKVDGVVKEDGTNYLLIGGNTYDAANVAGVMDSSSVENSLDGDILESAGLIGRTVTASVTAEDGTTTPVTGVVSSILVQEGTIYAVVGEQNIPVSNITEISNE
jgi:flagellar basal-body rod modification protein FlgD